MFIISNKKNLLVLPFIITFVVVSMFSNWEMGGETWGYWYFAHIFKIQRKQHPRVLHQPTVRQTRHARGAAQSTK